MCNKNIFSCRITKCMFFSKFYDFFIYRGNDSGFSSTQRNYQNASSNSDIPCCQCGNPGKRYFTNLFCPYPTLHTFPVAVKSLCPCRPILFLWQSKVCAHVIPYFSCGNQKSVPMSSHTFLISVWFLRRWCCTRSLLEHHVIYAAGR